jgi:hypothetical protein
MSSFMSLQLAQAKSSQSVLTPSRKHKIEEAHFEDVKSDDD